MTFEGLGLVSAGGVNQSFLTRLPSLLARVGPIKASSYRVSRQISNALCAGRAVSHYSVLEACPAIFVSVPEPCLCRTLGDLAAQTPLLKAPSCRTMVVLCGCVRDSQAPGPLRGTGARVASLNPVPGSGEQIFVAEGHRDTVRMLKSLMREDKRKLIELKPGAKPLFLAGVNAAAPLLLPWIAGGMECLRAAGFSRPEAAAVGEFLGVHALHGYARAGARVWNRQTAASLRRALQHDLPAISSWNKGLADLYRQGIQVALEAFREYEDSPRLTDKIRTAESGG
jgi:hypothetical protein